MKPDRTVTVLLVPAVAFGILAIPFVLVSFTIAITLLLLGMLLLGVSTLIFLVRLMRGKTA